MKRLFKFFLKLLCWFIGGTVFWVVLYKYVPVPYTPLMGIRSIRGSESYESKHDWVPIENISEGLQRSVICAEDQKFLTHNGFDYEAIEKAIDYNRNGKKIRGGSTISQQVAKNVFLWPSRTYLRKGLEAYFTFLIETLWSKERILEVYLNSVEMGDGVFGAEAAAQYWFQKKASSLNHHEAAALAAILPNPRNYSPNPRTKYIEGRKQWILRQMNNFGVVNFSEE